MWYQKSKEEILTSLGSSEKGLSLEACEKKREEFGENRLQEGESRKLSELILEQVKNTMVIILILAAVISGFLGDRVEMIAILAIVVLFVVLGFTQEARAEKAMAALKKLSVPKVRTIRGGVEQEISATQLVPGDIIILETGNIVPADARIIESINLKTQESMLTGEVESVEKHSEALAEEGLALGDRKNIVYMGTIVTYGRGQAVVVDTGMKTELGKIAFMLQGIEKQQTPLQKQLDRIGKQLAIIGVICAVIIMVIGFLSGAHFDEMLLTAVSVAVAVVPEGLPAVVTITLALGAQKMLKRHALIRKLPAVETLGSVNIICSDKTGTLTENKMTVTLIDLDGERIEIANRESLKVARELKKHPILDTVLMAGTLCSDAKLIENGKNNEFLGDPTEGALVVAAKNGGLELEALYKNFPRIGEIPFDSVRKRMSTLHEAHSLEESVLGTGKYILFTKGSVDGILEVATHYVTHTGTRTLESDVKARILNANEKMASNGVRVLALTAKLQNDTELKEENLIFLGLIGMIDPPRAEVKGAIAECKSAQIRPIMITGDHPLTARFIAAELGIDTHAGALTGRELDLLTNDEFYAAVKEVSVYARVSPEHKIKIVETLQRQGNVVAMTGDGVNDSPALKKADIGVAMGITGTDVTKEASAMILLDDNFATIVASVEEGRTIFDNIKRFISYSLAGNIGKVVVMLAAPLFALFAHKEIPISLVPLQLLWLNLLTDGLLGIGLGVESSEKDVMMRKPNDMAKSIFAGRFGLRTLFVGIVISILCIVVTLGYIKHGSEKWQTILFTLIALLQITQSVSARTLNGTVLKKNLFGNKLLNLMIVLVFVLQIVVIYFKPLAELFNIQALDVKDWGIMVLTCILFFIILEVEKSIKSK